MAHSKQNHSEKAKPEPVPQVQAGEDETSQREALRSTKKAADKDTLAKGDPSTTKTKPQR
jgi:hypothetical protein